MEESKDYCIVIPHIGGNMEQQTERTSQQFDIKV